MKLQMGIDMLDASPGLHTSCQAQGLQAVSGALPNIVCLAFVDMVGHSVD